MSEWTPSELDFIEDALESLEDDRVHAADPRVLARLAEYRDILRWSRQALLTEDAPPHVLEAVMAEARDAAAVVEVDSAGAEPAAAPARTPWWKRFGALVAIPGLAVAGTTALVLVLVRIQGEGDAVLAEAAPPPSPASQAPVSTPEPGDARLADASLERQKAEQAEEEDLLRTQAERGGAASEPPGGAIGGVARGPMQEQRAEAEPAARRDEEAKPIPASEPVADAAKKVTTAARAREGSGAGERVDGAKTPVPTKPTTSSGAKQEPPPAPKPKAKAERPAADAPVPPVPSEKNVAPADRDDDVASDWSAIAGADRQRHEGRCSTARATYRRLQDAMDRQVRARAWAGLGLCEEQAGNLGVAKGHYAKAEALDSDIRAFIAREQASTAPKAKSAEPRE